MAWVYIVIAIGAAGFLIWIVIDYLNVSSGLKPKADLARQEIRECEMRIEGEQAATSSTKEEVESLQKEIGELEKELNEVAKKVEEYQQRERRRKPTKFKLEE
jgi:septal ring factor EnvC (AmiA/AmiB activator)